MQQQTVPSATSTKAWKRRRKYFFDTKCTIQKCIIYSTLHPFLDGCENNSLVFTGGRERKQCTENKKNLLRLQDQTSQILKSYEKGHL